MRIRIQYRDSTFISTKGIVMEKPAFNHPEVSVEIPDELRGSLLCDAETVSIPDSVLTQHGLDSANIVIRPISQGKMEEIAQRVAADIHSLPYHIIHESLVSPAMSISEIKNLESRTVDFIFAEIYKINGFRFCP
jgi:hypothetical protein